MNKAQKLIKRVNANREARAAELERTRERRERHKEIREAPGRTRIDFWCDECASDFQGTGWKVTRNMASDKLPIAWYVGWCPVGHKAIRQITEKYLDPYYNRSAVIRAQRQEFADAMLTPNDPRFRILYPDQWRKLEEEREIADLEAKANPPTPPIYG